MNSLAKNQIETVLGPIKPELLGVTLCHEHLYHHIRGETFLPKPLDSDHTHLNDTEVKAENMWYTSFHPYTHKDNLNFTTNQIQSIISDELSFYKANGGSSIVELTTVGKSVHSLREMALKTGVNVISNTGNYVFQAFPQEIYTQGVEKLYHTMQHELLVGIDGIKAGVIGEIGTGWPLHRFEMNNLIAAAQLQDQLNVPVIIHPGRDPQAPFEVMRIFAEAGGKMSKTIMSHLDRTLNDEQLMEFAQLGAICELDLFGLETSYYELSLDFDMPNDAYRIQQVKLLLDQGYGDSVTISHDIHTKHRLMHFGGHGYSHILMNVVPKMRRKGITDQQIHQMLVDTPKKWLTL